MAEIASQGRVTFQRNTVLVTGGAGYIGSHASRQLQNEGYSIVVLDNLSTGWSWAIPQGAAFIRGDVGDAALLTKIFGEYRIDSVMHFAGSTRVDESVANPLKYYRNNVAASQTLIEASVAAGVKKFVFSSSAAVYGIPEILPVTEDCDTAPLSPYGKSKLITEWLLKDLSQSTPNDFRHVSLRYFNVAGASQDGTLGQATPRATHLIKVACEAVCGRRGSVEIFGTDYPTKDGTGVRDYIHIEDLASAHVQALTYLDDGGESQTFNCGYGFGFSVREVLSAVRAVSGVDFVVTETGRRPGDSPELFANSTRIREVLGWKPRYDDLRTICESALRWEENLSGKAVATPPAVVPEVTALEGTERAMNELR